MNNTILTAQNTFSEGMIMDYAPDVTPANSLTSALNATLLTFNGNEMSLLNDMGNGRVETAFLPLGYVPLGTCEYGDIIYIVSYNPLTNKSLIGCFPSPERNISSEEISKITQVLTSEDFQEISEGVPTGKLKATSIKKILLDSKELSPGDKFIIYGINKALENNQKELSDYGNRTHIHNDFPKLLKLHVISIDDSGKITYLDSSSKWYDSNQYYFQDLVKTIEEKPNIDSYRTLVSSAYLIFQSKNSGKLAVLAELEKIKSFNCAYSIIPITNGNTTTCHVYLHSSWTNDNPNINPTGLAIIKSEWVGDNGGTYREPSYNSTNKLYEYSETLLTLPLPVKPLYDLLIEFKNYYHLDSGGNYEEFISDPTTNIELQNAHKISYNKYLTDTYTGTNGSTFPKVSRIVPAKNDNIYTIGKYYLNLDEIEYSSNTKIYKSKDNNGKLQTISALSISDDIINNYHNRDVIKELASVNLPMYTLIDSKTKAPNDLKNLVWAITVAPCMPYGVLEEYAIDMVIDFNTITKDDIVLTNWRYWNLGESLTLTYGLDIKLTNNQLVKDVSLEFYDNLGLVATYINSNKSSYSGLFTERFGLEGSGTNYKLLKISYDGKPILHAGSACLEDFLEGLIALDNNGKPRLANKEDNILYYNDAGTLYPNFLYKVLVKIHYGYKDELGNFIGELLTKEYSRWFWTNSMYNDYYHNVDNFDTLPLELELSALYKIQSTTNYNLNRSTYINSEMDPDSENIKINTLGASVTHINQDGSQKNNLNLKLTDIGLSKSYGTLFFLKDSNNSFTNLVNVKVSLGYKYINIDEVSYIPSIESESMDFLKPIKDENLLTSLGMLDNTKIGNKLKQLLNISIDNKESTIKELWEIAEESESAPYLNYKSTFDISLEKTDEKPQEGTYEDSDGINREITELFTTTGYNLINKGINMTLTGISFTKQCFLNSEEISGQYPVIKSLIRSKRNRDLLGIKYDYNKNTFYFDRMVNFLFEYKEDESGGLNIRICNNSEESHASSNVITNFSDQKHNYIYNSEDVLSALEQNDFNSPLLLICWCRHHKKDEMHFENATVRLLGFEKYNREKPSGPSAEDTKGNDAKSYLILLALYTPNKGLYILNDGIGITNKNYALSDVKQNITTLNGLSTETLGNLIMSMLSLLYYVTGEYESYSKKKFGTLCSPDTYNEIWGLHILLSLDSNDINKNNFNKFIGFGNGMSLDTYLKTFDLNFDKTSSNNCVTAHIRESLMLIDFKYSIPKDDKFKMLYEDKSENINSIIYYSDKKESNISSQIFPEEELYYIDDSNGSFQPLIKDFLYYPCSFTNIKGEKITNNDDIILALKKLAAPIKVYELGKLIEYDKNRLFKIRLYPFTNLYKITIGKEDTHKNNWYTGLSIDAKFTGVWDIFNHTT